MNSNTLDKESDRSLAKHFLNFRKTVEVVFLNLGPVNVCPKGTH